jgi:hypothetical protein
MWDAQQLLGTASHMRSNFVEDIGSSIKGSVGRFVRPRGNLMQALDFM